MKLGFIGAGNMGAALMCGLLKQAFPPEQIAVHTHTQARQQFLADKYHVIAKEDNQAVVDFADVVFLAVKPNVAAEVLAEIAPTLATKKVVLVSMVAGLSLEKLAAATNHHQAIMRIMPNVNAAINAGVCAVVKNANTPAEVANQVQALLQKTGEVFEVSEEQFAIFTALAGSAPAYVYAFIDAMAKAGVNYGLKKAMAVKLVAAMMAGSAQNVLSQEKSPQDLIDDVCSPAGTTIAGILVLDEANFNHAVHKSIEATVNKAYEK